MSTAPATASGPRDADSPARLGAIRYMGNKLALLPRILEAVERLAPEGTLVVDPMAGSHSVTYALKHRHRILSSDAQHYSMALGRAFVDNVSASRPSRGFLEGLRSEAERGLAELAEGSPGFLERSFADTYLGRHQCRQLDALRRAIDDVADADTCPALADDRRFGAGTAGAEAPLDGPCAERWMALATLFTAACRAQASPGHFAQFLPPDHPRTLPLREIDLFEVVFERLATLEVRPGLPGSESLALPWRSLVEARRVALGGAALWYLDPPYTRDQYSRFYHFLETLSRGDEPELRHGARYREDRFRSSFCSPVRAARELADLLDAVRRTSPRASVLLSYSSRGLLSREELLECARGFELAGFTEIPHAYSTQGKGMLEGVTEWLVSWRPTRTGRRRGGRPSYPDDSPARATGPGHGCRRTAADRPPRGEEP